MRPPAFQHVFEKSPDKQISAGRHDQRGDPFFSSLNEGVKQYQKRKGDHDAQEPDAERAADEPGKECQGAAKLNLLIQLRLVDLIHIDASTSAPPTRFPTCRFTVELDQDQQQAGNGRYVYGHDFGDVRPPPTDPGPNQENRKKKKCKISFHRPASPSPLPKTLELLS